MMPSSEADDRGMMAEKVHDGGALWGGIASAAIPFCRADAMG